MRRGVRIGVDVGRARVGVARCDPDGLLATPLETLPRDERTVAGILAHAGEWDAVELVVGLPLSLSGGDTASTADAREVADALAGATELPVRLVDERLSTVTAHRQLQAGGRRAKGSRSVIDQVAAVIILQNALDSERTSGRPPGTLVHRTKDPDSGL
ncbi:Holliday junction resolvase RuvX [Protaetiibacter intestinalis]|uniref:Putative pre-16S rRNA nuclease n=1 Tax=Protaetiibacter intestinalis TaxID=2419774 RepID=A0A387BBN6_9MICO|nr:Holliday junction resolvase RuvX [Protaetiibacter intestinalis]AYF99118.1 Holliday junction resolvase RuvX [Protaetiibacter intestinalis]